MTEDLLRHIAISFDPPGELINLNKSKHYRVAAAERAVWREAAYYAAFRARTKWAPGMRRSRVTVRLPVVGTRRRDPHNFSPTIKPIVDGFVDARVWPDDTPEWVVTTEPVLVRHDRPGGHVIVILEELES